MLLRAHRAGTVRLKHLDETLCVDLCARGRVGLGHRTVMGRLWYQYGRPTMLDRADPKTVEDEQLRQALSA